VAVTAAVEVDPAAIPAGVARAIDVVSEGNMTRFAETIGTSLAAVSLWKDGRRSPSLGHALRLCRAAGFELVDFLAGRLEALAAAPALDAPASLPTTRQPYRRIDWPAVEAGMRAALNERLGAKDQALHRRFPDLAGAVVARHAAHRAAESTARNAEQVALVLAAIDAIVAVGRKDHGDPCRANAAVTIGGFADPSVQLWWADVGFMLDSGAAVHRSVLRMIARP
jgi:transcriptional regulator with XRE-family HTH domain